MKNPILSILEDYLQSKETDYALMINGEWGSGKTYFVLHEIKSAIEKINSPRSEKGNNGKFKQIYVSLYGISSIEDIKDTIFYALNPKFKLLEPITNRIICVTSAIPVIGSAVKDTLSINEKEKASIKNAISKFDDKVIFFDDLERIDKKKIDIQSVLGYINFLSEHNHYKIVVVANDEVLDDDYKQFKEKTIRFSYNYYPNLSEIFDSVCKKYDCKDEDGYGTFLKKQKEFILDIILAGECKNIRTLIFITDVFQKIFKKTAGKYSNEINKYLLLSFAIISIEAKDGHTKEELKDSLKSINSLFISDFLSKQNQSTNGTSNPKEEYEEAIYNKYGRFNHNQTIHFYDELFDLVYDGYVSQDNLDNIIKTIRNEYIGKDETKEKKLAKRIINWSQISDGEFRDVVDKVNNAVSSGVYDVYYLLKIYVAFIQIEAMKIEDFTLTEKVTQSFKFAIDVTMQKQSYLPAFDMNVPLWDEDDKSEAKSKYNELRKYASDINEKHKDELTLTKKKKILDTISNSEVDNFKEFIYDINKKFLFLEISPEKIVNAVTLANVETKLIFLQGLRAFFPENLTNPSKKDSDYLNNIKCALDKYLNKQKTRKISLANLFKAQNYIDNVIERYKRRLSIQ